MQGALPIGAMCQNVPYMLWAATGTREETERPAEWKDTTEEDPERPQLVAP